ncbi:MAG TPA: hypothetical protein PLZ51_19390, partial [Aggregatilineales bacterium]|nr:hypothetical protein [Aggregatilineales bacterium]
NGENTIRIWDTQTWDVIHTLTMDETAIRGTMIYSPDGQFLATTFVSMRQGDPDYNNYPHIQIWNAQTWELYQDFDVISSWSGWR